MIPGTRFPQPRDGDLVLNELPAHPRGVSAPTFFDAAANLIWGATCAGCDRPAAVLCRSCRGAVSAQPFVALPTPTPAALALMPPVAAGVYGDELRNVLADFKERGRFTLTGLLGQMLAAAVETSVPNADPLVLVPIPSSRESVRARGFDAVSDLANSAAAQLRRQGREARVAHVLRHARRVADQSGLDAPSRKINLEGAFVARRPGRRGLVVIVDDIVTTGSTLAEAVRALECQGVTVDGLAAVAATRRYGRKPL